MPAEWMSCVLPRSNWSFIACWTVGLVNSSLDSLSIFQSPHPANGSTGDHQRGPRLGWSCNLKPAGQCHHLCTSIEGQLQSSEADNMIRRFCHSFLANPLSPRPPPPPPHLCLSKGGSKRGQLSHRALQPVVHRDVSVFGAFFGFQLPLSLSSVDSFTEAAFHVLSEGLLHYWLNVHRSILYSTDDVFDTAILIALRLSS